MPSFPLLLSVIPYNIKINIQLICRNILIKNILNISIIFAKKTKKLMTGRHILSQIGL